MLVNLKVAVTPSYCNNWPFFKISHNSNVLWDGQVTAHQIFDFNIECNKENTLSFEHYGKRFGENGVWDTTETEDRFIFLDDIKLDQVSIGDKLKHAMVLKTKDGQELQTYGSMNFNGVMDFYFETPVYDWLILAKYKEPMEDMTFFSNYTARWHYEKDREIIQEIKDLFGGDIK